MTDLRGCPEANPTAYEVTYDVRLEASSVGSDGTDIDSYSNSTVLTIITAFVMVPQDLLYQWWLIIFTKSPCSIA